MLIGLDSCLAEEFIYPVASIDEQTILLVRQKSLDEVELLLWDAPNKIATKQLSTMFLPSQVKLLPSKKGFSFVDKGRIRIKRFEKRAPRSIDILEPIDSIISMSWINDDQFYFTGKHYQQYKVFLCDISDRSNPQVFKISGHDDMDNLYPSKINSKLFYVAKDGSKYHIVEQNWNPRPHDNQAAESLNLIYTCKEPLCFLEMKNEHEGYFLKCTVHPEQGDMLTFTCCRSIFDTDWWSVQPLFTFRLPMQYLMGDSLHRVYESIHPFLPVYEKDVIFYVNYDQDLEKCLLYKYDKSTKEAEPFLSKSEQNTEGFLAPLCINDTLYHGLIMSARKAKNIVSMNEETGEIDLELPAENL